MKTRSDWLAAVAVLLLVMHVAACMGDTRPKIIIEWGIAPEELEGLEVEIDGKVAGKLQKFGEATRTAFPVSKGDHTVRIRHPKRESQAIQVATELSTQRVMLLV